MVACGGGRGSYSPCSSGLYVYTYIIHKHVIFLFSMLENGRGGNEISPCLPPSLILYYFSSYFPGLVVLLLLPFYLFAIYFLFCFAFVFLSCYHTHKVFSSKTQLFQLGSQTDTYTVVQGTLDIFFVLFNKKSLFFLFFSASSFSSYLAKTYTHTDNNMNKKVFKEEGKSFKINFFFF